MNRQLFYGGYHAREGPVRQHRLRTPKACPRPDELALLEPWRGKMPPKVFGPMVVPPSTEPPGSAARQPAPGAAAAEARPAGHTATARCATPRARRSTSSTCDSSARAACAPSRPGRATREAGHPLKFRIGRLRALPAAPGQVRVRDDHASTSPARTAPGSELAEIFGSKAANDRGLGQLLGMSRPGGRCAAADRSCAPTTAAELLRGLPRAGPRASSHGHYLIPQWTLTMPSGSPTAPGAFGCQGADAALLPGGRGLGHDHLVGLASRQQ